MKCTDFRRNPDGSWTCINATKIPGYAGVVDVALGQVIKPGEIIGGIVIALWLDKNCPQAEQKK
jgi:hypothetical protein